MFDKVLYVIRKRIISYSGENATQKIWKVQWIPCLDKIERLSYVRSPYPRLSAYGRTTRPLKRKKAVKEKNLQPPSILL